MRYIVFLAVFAFSAVCLGSVLAQTNDEKEVELRLREIMLKNSFASQGLYWPPKDLFLVFYKRDSVEDCGGEAANVSRLYAFSRDSSGRFQRVFAASNVCISGSFGPKNQEGDGQVPEGVYEITAFNPNSNFVLSMRLNYPNAVDRARNAGSGNPLGGDIYVHGSCASIGCISIGEGIFDLYPLCKAAKTRNGKLPLYSFPMPMNHRLFTILYQQSDRVLKTFWDSLAPIHEAFVSRHRPGWQPPRVEITGGKYVMR